MNAVDKPCLIARWGTFVRERFPPTAHLIMAGAFFLGNAAAAQAVQGGGPFPRWRALCAFLIVLLFFLRLRIFDELKDLAYDRAVNPGRPLARGLLSASEARAGALILLLVEAGLAAACGGPTLAAWLPAMAWSGLMYREFLVGHWLRPKLELYALSHTLVAAFLGLVPAAARTGSLPWELDSGLWLFGMANWSVFNVFEFGRKTFAPEEERPGVDSYSLRLFPLGAAALCLAWVMVACAILHVLLRSGPFPGAFLGPALLALAALCPALAYASRPSRPLARFFRAAMLWFTVGYYALLLLLVLAGGMA